MREHFTKFYSENRQQFHLEIRLKSSERIEKRHSKEEHRFSGNGKRRAKKKCFNNHDNGVAATIKYLYTDDEAAVRRKKKRPKYH